MALSFHPETRTRTYIGPDCNERRFRLADYVEVESANLSNGLLNIILVRELPEAMKPRKIEISTSKVIEG